MIKRGRPLILYFVWYCYAGWRVDLTTYAIACFDNKREGVSIDPNDSAGFLFLISKVLYLLVNQHRASYVRVNMLRRAFYFAIEGKEFIENGFRHYHRYGNAILLKHSADYIGKSRWEVLVVHLYREAYDKILV